MTSLTFVQLYNSADEGGFPSKLTDLKDLIDNLVSKVPAEHLDRAFVDIFPSSPLQLYTSAVVEISYARPRTNEEALASHDKAKEILEKEIEAKSKQLRELCSRFPAL
jgi:hypothetical protein